MTRAHLLALSVVAFCLLYTPATRAQWWANDEGHVLAPPRAIMFETVGVQRVADLQSAGGSWTGLCHGWIDSSRPGIRVRVPASGAWLGVASVASEINTVMVVRAPDGTFLCDDDGGPGTNSALSLSEPGEYRVWAGFYSQRQQPTPVQMLVAYGLHGVPAATTSPSGP